MQIANLFFKLEIKNVKKLTQALLKFYINSKYVLFTIKINIYVTQNVNNNLKSFKVIKLINLIYINITRYILFNSRNNVNSLSNKVEKVISINLKLVLNT